MMLNEIANSIEGSIRISDDERDRKTQHIDTVAEKNNEKTCTAEFI